MKLTRRLRFVLLAVTGVILIAATIYTMQSDDAGRVAGRLGPTSASTDGYIATKKAYLDRVAKANSTQHGAALVSLNKYVTAPAAQTFASSMESSAVFVRFPKTEPEPVLVTTTIAGAVADRATDYRNEIEAEIDALTEEAAKATGAGKANLAGVIAERKAVLAGVKADCVCVYAFAVKEAELGELAQLSKRPEARLVDVPDPVVNDLGGWELKPILPKTPAV